MPLHYFFTIKNSSTNFTHKDIVPSMHLSMFLEFMSKCKILATCFTYETCWLPIYTVYCLVMSIKTCMGKKSSITFYTFDWVFFSQMLSIVGVILVSKSKNKLTKYWQKKGEYYIKKKLNWDNLNRQAFLIKRGCYAISPINFPDCVITVNYIILNDKLVNKAEKCIGPNCPQINI